MKITRRQFIKGAAATGVALSLPLKFGVRSAHAYAVSPRLQKFVTPLPIFGADIPLAVPDTDTYPGMDYYQIEVGVFRQQLHPDLPAGGTRLYGYRQAGGTYQHQHLGAPVLAQKGRPVRIKFTCSLPTGHIIPFDASIPQGPGGTYVSSDRAAIHLHGGLVPWPSDGGPFHWISTSGSQGSALPGGGWLPSDASGTTLTNDYFYPNNQSARFMWYHDHAIGITRTNAYAGVATGYLITDTVELGLGIPVPGDVLVFQDKVFYDPAIDPNYATYAGPTTLGGAVLGDLWYPYIYDPKIWKLIKSNLPLPIPSCVAEMFGDTMLVNGMVYPYQNVSGMKRYRLLNACNARFLNLSFAVENPKNPGEPKVDNKGLPLWAPVKVWQIGNEGGFLPTPVLLADTTVPGAVPTPLLLAPAERADIIVDFRPAAAAGVNIILYNDAPAPFPGGSPLFDFWTGANNTKRGFGPNTRTPMRFNVSSGGDIFNVPTTIQVPMLNTAADPVNGGLTLVDNAGHTDPTTYSNFTVAGKDYTWGGIQNLTLNEAFDQYGRLSQLVGNVNNAGGLFGSPYWDGPGEMVTYGTVQIWNIFNLTADTHPMHVHLFNVMVLRRQPFKVNQFNGVPVFTGPGLPPDPNEIGWKETVRINPGECTTVAVLVENPFDLPLLDGVSGDPVNRSYTFNVGNTPNVVGTVPYSPRLATFNVTGDEYVWHCHILEHEEHDMMHSLVGQDQ